VRFMARDGRPSSAAGASRGITWGILTTCTVSVITKRTASARIILAQATALDLGAVRSYDRCMPDRERLLGPLWLPLTLALAAQSAGCGGEAPAPSFHYPLDGALRFNHVQTKATHNSYHVEIPGNSLPAWAYTHAKLEDQLENQGVRGFELDIHFSEEANAFEVYHLDSLDEGTTCRRFMVCLEQIRRWSDDHPAHEPLIVHIEPKDGFGWIDPTAFFAHLEAEILLIWPRDRVITPALVQGSAASLLDAVKAHGWPTLGALRGKVGFVMDNSSDFRKAYTHLGKNLDGRLIFVNSRPGDPFGAYAIINDPIGDAATLKDALAAGFMVRTRADGDNVEPLAGDTHVRDAALAIGAQVISTDYPMPVANVNYSMEIPGGTPSRCSPVNAPANCTSKAIEDPAFMRQP
jgi:hypothetical protein